MTDYPLGVFRLYSFKVHGLLDYGVAAASGFMPEMTGTRPHRPVGKYFRIQGAGETGIAAITNYDDHTGSGVDTTCFLSVIFKSKQKAPQRCGAFFVERRNETGPGKKR